jgi:nicotinamidase-related amidase
MNVQLLIVDPQNDFCTPAQELFDKQGKKLKDEPRARGASLYVPGANEDMQRLAAMILRLSTKLDDIHVTLDSHRMVQIFHPIFWKDAHGRHPSPFTVISVDDVEKGKWVTTNPAYARVALDYVRSLAANKRYVLCIWPYHCLIGTWGHSVHSDVSEALLRWEEDNFAVVDYVTKGSNITTEHYSGVRAEVIDPMDPTTMLNTELIGILNKADLIPFGGEALSHCLANTLSDVAAEFGDDNVKKLVLLEDCTSNVPGFEQLGKDFVAKMVKKGMQVAKSTDFLK